MHPDLIIFRGIFQASKGLKLSSRKAIISLLLAVWGFVLYTLVTESTSMFLSNFPILQWHL